MISDSILEKELCFPFAENKNWYLLLDYLNFYLLNQKNNHY